MAAKKTTNRPYPYYPVKAAGKGKLPGTEWFVHACERRYKFKNLGTYVVRDMRGKPGQLSVHATGAALDVGFNGQNAKVVADAWQWFMDHTREL